MPDTERGETFRLKHEELGTEDGARAGADWCELDISRYCCLVPGVQDRGWQGPLFRTSNQAKVAWLLHSVWHRKGEGLIWLETKNCKSLYFIKPHVSVLPRLVYNILMCCYDSLVKYGSKERYIYTFIHKVIRILDCGYFGFCHLIPRKNTLKTKTSKYI